MTEHDLYDADVLRWSERQAGLLRRVAAGELIHDQVDWVNIIEEIESVARAEFHAVQLFLTRALVHMLRAEAWPLAPSAPLWQAEARLWRIEAADRFTPSMRSRINVARLYRRALLILPKTLDGTLPLSLPHVCPVTLDALLSEDDG